MANWKKGALHTHTYWSDGRALPEEAIYIYRDKLNFDFVCITDHNIFPGEENICFQSVPNPPLMWPPLLNDADVKRARELLGDKIESRKLGIRNIVNLKTFARLQEQWDIPGKFLLIGGSEMNCSHFIDANQEYDEFHLNSINCHRTIYPLLGQTPRETLRMNLDLYEKTASEEKCNSFVMVNHPFWRYWDVDPRLLVDFHDVKFLEICNNGVAADIKADDPVNTPEKYWDFVLAHRLANGNGVIYGTACDDAHLYSPEESHGFCGVNHGWVMVNCPGEMSVDNLINAMKAGDFYASNGVYFDQIDFNDDTRTLKVKVSPESGVKYTIRFFVTKKNFCRKIEEKHFHHEKPTWCRNIPVVGDDIGVCVKEISGIEGEYTMEPDDLYVRAEAVSDTLSELQVMFYPETQKAWTQPFI